VNAKQRRTRRRHTQFMIKRVDQLVEQSIEKTYQHFKREVPKKVMLEISDRLKAEFHLIKTEVVR